ncbi:hypothetical protein ONE63_002872 [Megalurothrips usitatus]|uniref:WASP family protein member n=1 Tax=Megalurothrips usitatus TaxID=439358 RepID=A0AAV7X9Z4_9NEOP|nr:hypothetical protein ONE63_002872 [Megalurothrips usitatus]
MTEGDLSVFAALPRDRHFRPAREPTKCLFSAESRPRALQQLYAAAGRAALGAEALDQLDRLRRDGARSSALFLCTPVLGRARHQRLRSKVVDIDIETRKPASILELRKWTSTEALGDMTVHPDCTVRILGTTVDGEVVDGPSAGDDAEGRSGSCRLGESTLRHDLTGTDHLLPTTEEQVKAIADRFPPQMVRMDVTGRSFQRMTRHRRSLIYPAGAAGGGGGGGGGGGAADEARRPRPRRQRSRRRNTIAGTDQKEIEEALHGDRPSTVSTLATVDDIILSSSTMLNDNPKSSKEVSADFRKWAFNSLKRWGRSRFRAISSINSSTSTNIVSGELHAADPVDDINVYETVAGKRRVGAGTIPISAGLSGPISLAVKLREGSLGQRRLKITDEPPHSSSGNWSASSESGRASVNSDSSHQPKSSTCSSILPHRRRFINTSTSSSVTSEGTLTPEDMAAVPFDDGETSSVYSCDTEGYYTSFHMDSGLKTLKEEEVGTGLSLPPTPMHSTSALSNCSSGRGSASLAQLTAESEYELFGKGSTSTTASSAGTVCTTLLADHSKSCDNSIGSNRSLSKGPAVPERKSSLAVPCLAEECPPCSTVVALIHNTNQGLSPRSSSGDSPDSGRNTSSSPIESVSCQQNDETDAFISPLPSIASEMEFSECSDFEGTDRIERIRVKTTINTSRIPSMCAITPPQSDDETNARQSVAVNYSTVQKKSERAPEPLPNHITEDTNRNDNYSYRAIHMTDNNANNAAVDSNCNARSTTPVASASLTSIIHVDKKSGYATVHALDNARRENNNNQKVRPPSPSGGTLFINPAIEEVEQTGQPLHQQPLIKDALIPFTNMLSKFRKASNIGRKLPAESLTGNHQTKCDFNSDTQENDESGEYVTITDVRNNNKPNVLAQCTPQRSEASEPARESSADRTWETLEYVSLNELPISNSTELQPAVLSGSSNESSLERRKRQGARVTLDSEGKVVYSSDSLRRRKGAHTTFAPGQYVKDPSASPSPSPVANHRMPKAVIRPVHSQTSSTFSHDPQKKSPVKSVTSQVNNNRGMNVASHQSIPSNISNNCRNGNTLQKTASSLQSQDSMNLKNKVIIRAGISSPTKDLVRSSLQPTTRPMPPRTAPVGRGAYVHVRPSDVPSIKANPMYLQTDFDGPEESMRASQTVQRPEMKTEGKNTENTNRCALTISSGAEGECLKNQKVKRSASYRLANFSPLTTICNMNMDKDQGGGDVDLGVADLDLGEAAAAAAAKLCLSPVVPNRVRSVANPNAVGRRVYGAQVMVHPNILLSLSPNRVTKPADTQKARVLSKSGNDTEIW